jgi:hypothetical protein
MGDVRAVLAHYEDDGVVRLPATAWVVTAPPVSGERSG